MRSILLCAFVLGLGACTTDVGQPTFQVVLNETIKEPDVLTKACNRPISESDARQAPFNTTFSGFSSKRSILGKDGSGQVTFVYRPKVGAVCTADMTFAFHQEATMKQYSKRNASYSSTIELSNVVVTAK
jgi:hypothetical protein